MGTEPTHHDDSSEDRADDRADGLADVYDEATLAALDRWSPGVGDEPPRRRGGGLAGGALLTAVALGLRDVLDGDDEGQALIELDPGFDDAGPRWVAFLPVWGAPARSRIVVRPWLAPG